MWARLIPMRLMKAVENVNKCVQEMQITILNAICTNDHKNANNKYKDFASRDTEIPKSFQVHIPT